VVLGAFEKLNSHLPLQPLRPGHRGPLPGAGRRDRRALGYRAGRAGDLRQRQRDVLTVVGALRPPHGGAAPTRGRCLASLILVVEPARYSRDTVVDRSTRWGCDTWR